MIGYFLILLCLLACRAADLLTTRLASPNLARELNPLVFLLGWRRTVLLNLLACPLVALLPLPAKILCVLSLAAAAMNLAVWGDR